MKKQVLLLILVQRPDLEEVDHHVERHVLLLIWVHHFGEVVERVPVDVDFRLENDSLELVEGDKTVLVLVYIIENVLDVVDLRRMEDGIRSIPRRASTRAFPEPWLLPTFFLFPSLFSAGISQTRTKANSSLGGCRSAISQVSQPFLLD